MNKGFVAAVLAAASFFSAAQAAEQPMIHKVELKGGGMGFMLTCANAAQCSTLGPRLCPGKTAMWSDSKGQFGSVPVTMRNNGDSALMIVKCE